MRVIGVPVGRILAGWLATMLLAPVAFADVYHGTPRNYREFISRLQPGDTLHLEAGDYHRGLPLHGVHGRDGAPVSIEGPKRGEPALFIGRAGHNTVSLANSSFLILRNIEIRDGGNFVDAVKAEGFRECESVHHITLEGLDIRGHGLSQQQVGISTKCPAWGWIIRNNHIVGAGTGIYLGDSDGNAPFFDGLIEGNRIEGTLGYNLQIKHQLARPDVQGAPQEPVTTIIRNNIFGKSAGSGDDRMARPNVLVGHPPLSGPGRDDEYLIYGNVFYGNPHEALFQGEGNVALYNNVFVNILMSGFPAIAIQPHNWIPKRIRAFGNTVVARSGGLRILSGGRPLHPLVQGNAIYADRPFEGVPATGNHAGSFEDAVNELKRPLAVPEELDPCPLPGRLEGAPGLHSSESALPGAELGFRGRVRSRQRYGAC